MEYMTKIPDIAFLSRDVMANGHSFGASSFHVLRLCTGVRKLALEFHKVKLRKFNVAHMLLLSRPQSCVEIVNTACIPTQPCGLIGPCCLRTVPHAVKTILNVFISSWHLTNT